MDLAITNQFSGGLPTIEELEILRPDKETRTALKKMLCLEVGTVVYVAALIFCIVYFKAWRPHKTLGQALFGIFLSLQWFLLAILVSPFVDRRVKKAKVLRERYDNLFKSFMRERVSELNRLSALLGNAPAGGLYRDSPSNVLEAAHDSLKKARVLIEQALRYYERLDETDRKSRWPIHELSCQLSRELDPLLERAGAKLRIQAPI